MAIKKVLQFGNPLLREKSRKVNNFNINLNKKIMRDLRDTLINLKKKHKTGGGLAAPQIGYLDRIVFLCAKGKSFFMFNPVIVKKSRQMFNVWDFCFSAGASFTAKIKRHKKISVEFFDETGNKYCEEYKDYRAELIQHEIDHLNGILFIDHIKNPTTIMMMEEWKKNFLLG